MSVQIEPNLAENTDADNRPTAEADAELQELDEGCAKGIISGGEGPRSTL
jgi:hypothetical protein